MLLHENLKMLRLTKGWSQEDMAAKLEYGSINGYAKGERGETFPKMDKLKKMAEILETEVESLLSSHEGNNFTTIKGNCHNNHQGQTVILLSESQCAHELEKAQLLLQERDKEIEYLKKMIALLESADKS
jgi:transcriptional regulator with XRE-family HTH domain